MRQAKFKRALMDVGNILAMEHVNVTVPNQSLATLFYVNLLGFTRDPYMDFGPSNVWINVGSEQFHLPTAEAQVLRGHIGVLVPNIKSLAVRLNKLGKRFKETEFAFKERKNFIDVRCPWGNTLRCFPSGTFGNAQIGIPYVEFHVPEDSVLGIGRFYERIMGCRAKISNNQKQCEISIGQEQFLRFREQRKPTIPYDGHHIAIYISNFSGPHQFLKENNLITQESDQNQYRFQDIVDPDSGKMLFEIEHEVRSLHHPLFKRHLINRNAEQSVFNYRKDLDAFTPEKMV